MEVNILDEEEVDCPGNDTSNIEISNNNCPEVTVSTEQRSVKTKHFHCCDMSKRVLRLLVAVIGAALLGSLIVIALKRRKCPFMGKGLAYFQDFMYLPSLYNKESSKDLNSSHILERLDSLRKECSEQIPLSKSTKHTQSNFLVDATNHILWCVPLSEMRSDLLEANTNFDAGLHYVNEESERLDDVKFDNYTKVLFVSHPYLFYFSALQYEPDVPPRLQSELCKVCDISYSFIGKFESFDIDYMTIQNTQRAGKQPRTKLLSSHCDALLDNYKNDENFMTNFTLMKELDMLYDADLNLFGYR